MQIMATFTAAVLGKDFPTIVFFPPIIKIPSNKDESEHGPC